MSTFISIDIGGSNTRVALIDEMWKIQHYDRFVTDATNPEKTIQAIMERIRIFGHNAKAIGLSCPGPLDLKNGVILDPPNLKGWHNFELKKMLEKESGLAVYIENDANLAALAEAHTPQRKKHRFVQYMTVSTGLGGGFIYDGKIFTGSNNHAQELANIILEPNGFKLNHLQPGSLESLCSGTGIVAQARAQGIDVEHAGEVYEKGQQGDNVCREIIDQAILYLGNAIAGAYAFLEPDVVVLGGSVALKIPYFVERVEERVKQIVYPSIAQYVHLEHAAYLDDSGLIGGAIYASQRMDSHDNV